MQKIIIRVVLDYQQEDVVRDLAVVPGVRLSLLHTAIVRAFDLPEGEMAAFYYTNESWQAGQEIPLLEMDEQTDDMNQYATQDLLSQKGDRLLYVYDFLHMWTFFLEVQDQREEEDQVAIKLVGKQGERPAEPPAASFEAEDGEDPLDDLDELLDWGEGQEN